MLRFISRNGLNYPTKIQNFPHTRNQNFFDFFVKKVCGFGGKD